MAGLHQSLKAEPNLTPILDMVFQLITFFMLVINFKAASLDTSLQLPVIGRALPPVETGERDVLVLNITPQGKLRMYGEVRDLEPCIAQEAKMTRQTAGGFSSKSGASGELPTTVIIRADRTTPYHFIHQVIQSCQAHGFRNFQYRVMSRGRSFMPRTRRHIEGDVQLNMAAMLDMAFQLLAFFILTYQPGKVEGCIAIRMPPPAPITKPDASNAGAPTPSEATALAGVVSLPIAVTDDGHGGISGIRVAEHQPVSRLEDFEQKLDSIMKVSDAPFDQILLKVSPQLEYENVLKIIEICARKKLTSSDQQKVSIVELQ